MQQELTMTAGMCPDCRMGPLDSANFKPAQYMDVVAQTGTQQLPAGSVDLNVYDSRTTFTSFQLNKWSDCKWLCHDEEHYKGSFLSGVLYRLSHSHQARIEPSSNRFPFGL